MATLGFEKCPADQRTTVWMSPTASGAVGITDVAVPLAAELNNTGGTSTVINASASVSWNDYSFGTQASETLNEPSFADAATYQTFGQANYGGSMSFWMPAAYDDNSNLHSLVYDLTDEPGALLDIAVRQDGDVLTSVAAANGDFVSVYRVELDSETNPFTPGESKRRTVDFLQKSEFSHLTIVGAHTITAIPPGSFAAGSKGRIRASVQSRDYTCALQFSTSDATVIDVYPGGFYKVTGTASDAATVTITDVEAGTSTPVSVTVS